MRGRKLNTLYFVYDAKTDYLLAWGNRHEYSTQFWTTDDCFGHLVNRVFCRQNKKCDILKMDCHGNNMQSSAEWGK